VVQLIQIGDVDWYTLRTTEGDNLLWEVRDKPDHIVLIPFEVLEDGLATFNEDPEKSVKLHKQKVDKAISVALRQNEWKELVRIGTGQRIFQLWLDRSHFSRD
jgi:hypothetical protein